jgi:hypothetical protein
MDRRECGALDTEESHDRTIHTVTRGLSPTEVCRPARLGSVASADAGSPVEIFGEDSVPTEVGRPANLRQLDFVPNTRSDDCRSPPTALARSS